jgi:hypothetical protein
MLQTAREVDWMRNNVGQDQVTRVRYGVGGVGGADLIGIRRCDGRFIACEVKGPSGKPTPEQLRFLERVRFSGGIGVLAYGVADVVEAIK